MGERPDRSRIASLCFLLCRSESGHVPKVAERAVQDPPGESGRDVPRSLVLELSLLASAVGGTAVGHDAARQEEEMSAAAPEEMGKVRRRRWEDGLRTTSTIGIQTRDKSRMLTRFI